MKARKHMLWSTRRKLARAAAGLLTASMLMQSMPLMAEEAAFAGEDLFSAETVEEVSVQDAAAALAEEDAYAPEAEAAEAAADLFAETPADADAAAEDSFAEEAAAVPEEDLLISEDEQTDDQGGEDLVIEGEEQTEASEEAEEGLTAEEILADDEALFAELFGEEEETEELPEMEEFFTSEEEVVEAGDPVVVTLPPAGSANAGKVLMSHAGAGNSSNWEGSYGAQLDGLALEIYNALVDYYSGGQTDVLVLDNTSISSVTFTAAIVNGVSESGKTTVNPADCDAKADIVSQVQYGMQSALDAFFYDHPEVFWIHGGKYSWFFGGHPSENDETIGEWRIANIRYTPEEIFPGASAYSAEYASGVASAITLIAENSDYNGDGVSTDAEKVRKIHDYVCDVLFYDFNGYANYKTTKDYRIFSSGAAFIPSWGGGAVCEGYAKAVKVLGDAFGLDIINVKGVALGEAHMWNGVNFGGTDYYLLDATWDDDDGGCDYTYFLIEDLPSERSKNGNFSGSDAGKAMEFFYPPFASDDYAYCEHAGHEFEMTGGYSICFFCGAKKIGEAEYSGLTDQVYSGAALEPVITVKYKGRTLSDQKDYTVSYENNIEAGIARVTITGIDSYFGVIEDEFTILPRSINTAGFVFGLPEEVIWTGEAQTPVMGVLSDDGILLAEGSDYTVTYENNTNCGDASVTFEGIGNYTGTKTLTFAITKGNMKDMSFDELTPVTYNGSKHEPQVVVRDGEGNLLTAGTDYTVSYSSNTNAGTAQVKVTGTGDYRGEKTLSFTIEKANINTAEIEVDGPVEYNGAKQEPGLTVIVDGRTLVKDTDFEVVYPANKNIDIGYGEYTVFGMGNYTGEKTGHFAIEAGNIAALSFEASAEEAWTGEERKPVVTITDAAGSQLTENEDYTVAYADNIDPGVGKITITGVGNYTRTKTLTFKIIRDITELTVSQPATQTYTGSALKPAVKVTTEDGTELVSGTDYTVTYKNNINVGTATVTVTGKGYYTGTMEVEFQVGARSVSGMTIAAIASKTYTGSAHKPAPKVTWGSKTLVSGTDYTVAYKNNTNAGTATVTVTGKGNYKGTLSATFKIAAKKITPAVTLSANAFTFNGKVRKPTVTVKDGTKTLTTADYTVTYASGRKNVGVYKVTVKLKGNYSGTKTVTFKINPKGTTVKTLTAASKAITVKWTKQATKMASSVITGYQIQLATNSTFTANKKLVTVAGFKKVSRKVTGLMGAKKYYVRIRTYKTISGTKYYSPWSKAKTVKTLK